MIVEIYLLFLVLFQLGLGNEVEKYDGMLGEDGNQLPQTGPQTLESSARTRRQTGLTCSKPVFYDVTYPSDCADILNSCLGQSPPSGIHEIQPYGGNVIRVYCDMETDGGGWTVFQRRTDGSIDFYRTWSNYQVGFGNLNTEFWLGNDNLHQLTSQKNYKLRVDLTNTLGNKYYAEYDNFRIGDSLTEYLLILGTYDSSSTAGDSFFFHNLHKFSTHDNDNDKEDSMNCASVDYGAWWFNTCNGHDSGYTHLNGKYYDYTGDDSVYWRDLPGNNDQIPFSEMKVRPQEF